MAINVDFPFHFDNSGRTAITGDDDHIRNMIEQFLFTNTGERVNRPDFGSGLLQLVFSPNSPELAAVVQHTIQAGLQRWLGDVILVKAVEVNSEESALHVTVNYQIHRSQETRVATFTRSTS